MRRLALVPICLAVLALLIGCSSSSLTPAEKAYASKVEHQSTVLSESFGRNSALMKSFHGPDPEWAASVKDECALWKSLYADAQTWNAPPKFATIQAKNLRMLALLDSAADDMTYSVDHFDVATMQAAADKITQASAIADQMSHDVDAMK